MLPALRAFARFLTRDPTQADDLVQDTVMRALAAQGQFVEGTNLKAWLFTIQRNLFYEMQRRRRRESEVLDQFGAETDYGATNARGGAEAGARIGELQRQIWALAPLLREALILVGAQELTYEEAAAICEVPVGTMKARVSRARAQLMQLAQAGQSEGEDGSL